MTNDFGLFDGITLSHVAFELSNNAYTTALPIIINWYIDILLTLLLCYIGGAMIIMITSSILMAVVAALLL